MTTQQLGVGPGIDPTTNPAADPATPQRRLRSRTAMLGMTALLGPLAGGLLGAATFFGIVGLAALSDARGFDAAAILAVMFYGAWAFGVGAVVGLVQALVALAAVLVLRAHRNLTVARVVGALGTLVLPGMVVIGDPSLWVLGLVGPASAVTAACLMRAITRSPARVGL